MVLNDEIASEGDYEVTAITTSSGSCTPAGLPAANAGVSCDLGAVAVGDTVEIVVTFTSMDGVDVNDIATAISATDDPDPSNNTHSVDFVVQGGIGNLGGPGGRRGQGAAGN